MLRLAEGSATNTINGATAATASTISTSMQKFSMPCQIKGVPNNTGRFVLNILYH